MEFALCLLFPALLWLAAGRAWRGFALIAAGVAGLVALLLTSGTAWTSPIDNGVLRGLCDFTVGVGMAVLFRAREADQRMPGLGAFG